MTKAQGLLAFRAYVEIGVGLGTIFEIFRLLKLLSNQLRLQNILLSMDSKTYP